MGWDYVSELQPWTDLLFIPRVVCEHGKSWWWFWLGITPNSSARPLWQSYQQRHMGQVGGMDEGVRITWSVKYLKRTVTCRKILRHGTSGFTSDQKEAVQWILIAFKNSLPLPGSNPGPLGSSGKHTNHYTTEATSWNVVGQRDCLILQKIWYILGWGNRNMSLFCNYKNYIG
jgi:hypothetical protein